ncbi:restriction endonuclease subunit S [Nocardia vaccinii]|uniref:restriction endonuclease subunit S n=1 Tax=Nocardia vaccinii TaxID=1822 RepID=UPI000AF88993|nr:restriction endonuclease subunit S [Nocardia vaccinii]
MSYPDRPLGDVLELVCDAVEVRAEDTYKIAGVYSFGRGLFERAPISGSQTQYRHLHRLHAGTVVLSKLKAFEGAIAVIGEEFDGRYLSPEFPTFIIDSTASDARYIHYLCAWRPLWARLAQKSTGIGSRRERVSPRQLKETLVPLPDLAEQHRVAVKLDAAMEKLARASRLRKSAQASYDALRESLITDASNSTLRNVGSVMKLKRRAVCVEPGNLYREIGLRSFGNGVFHKPAVTGESLGAKKIFSIEPGDLLFSSVFAWEGAVARASEAERGRVGSHRFMTYVVDQTLASPDYLRFLFLSACGLEVLRRCSPGGAGRNKTLGIKAFEAAQIPLPSLREQQRIANILLTAERVSRRLSTEYEQRAETLRVSLLDSAFTGML